MGNLFKSSPKHFTLVVVLVTLLGNCVQVENTADDDFSRYLKSAMNNYTSWMRANQLDPSPSTANFIKSGQYDSHISFNCNLSNHYVIGQSGIGYNSISSSSFARHTFQMGWDSKDYYESHGDFNCIGILNVRYFPELGRNLTFSGRGNFRIGQNYSTEHLTMLNVGITRDYRLDLSHAWPSYELDAYQLSVRLQGEWNDTRISGKYFEEVKNRFGYLFQNYPFFYDDTPSFPSGQLLNRYLRKIAQEVNLRQIVDVSYLPPPYAPTPRPGTTQRPKPGAGDRASIQAVGLVLLQVLLLFFSI